MDAAVEAQHRLPLHFGRMRGQHGGDARSVELFLHGAAFDLIGLQLAHGFRQAAFGGIVPRVFVNLAAAFVVHVFGDVQNLREQPAGQRQIVGLLLVQFRQHLFDNRAAVVGRGQQFDRFHHLRRSFLVQQVEQRLLQKLRIRRQRRVFRIIEDMELHDFSRFPLHLNETIV